MAQCCSVIVVLPRFSSGVVIVVTIRLPDRQLESSTTLIDAGAVTFVFSKI
jgi:hypothetical protein